MLPKEHYASREEVRAVCEPLVQAWQVLIAVDLGFIDVHLKYERTEVVDRAPTPGVVEIQLEGVAGISVVGTMTAVSLLKRHVQAPDPTLRITPDVNSLWQRYCQYRRGKEPLLSMAYFVLTVVEGLGGGTRAMAAATFNVEPKVLAKIGELTANRGDRATARKMKANRAESPLTHEEQTWLEKAVQNLILQVGRRNGAPPPTALRLADLPSP